MMLYLSNAPLSTYVLEFSIYGIPIKQCNIYYNSGIEDDITMILVTK